MRFKVSQKICQSLVLVFAIAMSSFTALAATPEPVGEVLFSRGVATAQQGGDIPRLVGKGEMVYQGDRLDTAEKSFAIVKFKDGTKMTLRANTALRVDDINVKQGEENALMSLLKGGLRSITGFISKRRDNAFRIKSSTATIGIRGTDFDARLCAEDCAREQAGAEDEEEDFTLIATAAMVNGKAYVKGLNGEKRRLNKGGQLRSGETVETEKYSFAILVFKDNTRISVKADSSFLIQDYQYETASRGQIAKKIKANNQARSGDTSTNQSAVFKLLKGGARILTGLIGKIRPESFSITTPVSTIGIRGTDVEASHRNGKSHTHVWSGEVFVKTSSGTLIIRQGETLYIPNNGVPVKLPSIPVFIEKDETPAPDSVKGSEQSKNDEKKETKPGLYVAVRDGKVELIQKNSVTEVNKNQAGYAGKTGTQQLPNTPTFMKNDKTPTPGQFDPETQKVLDVIKDEVEGLTCS